MKTIKIILENLGSNVGTFQPICFKESFKGDMNEKCVRCLSYDDDRLVDADRYSSSTITIPDWMDEQFYMSHSVKWHYLRVIMGEFAMQLTKEQFYKVKGLTDRYQYFIGWLMSKKNTKNDFTQSMQMRVTNWLEGNMPQYDKPLSENQFVAAAKYCPLYQADRLSNLLYAAKSYWSY